MKPSTLAMPFVRMESDGFWHVVRRNEGESPFGRPERSVAQPHERVFGARLDEVLYQHLQVEENRRLLRSVLVGDRYFSNEARENLLQQGFVNQEAFIYSEELLNNPEDPRVREALPLEESICRSAIRAFDARLSRPTTTAAPCAVSASAPSTATPSWKRRTSFPGVRLGMTGP